jgi:hypothetical protein
MPTRAALMQRSFGFDVLACPRCAGRMTLVALIRTPAVVARILRHLGEPTELPRLWPSRDPPARSIFQDDGVQNRRWVELTGTRRPEVCARWGFLGRSGVWGWPRGCPGGVWRSMRRFDAPVRATLIRPVSGKAGYVAAGTPLNANDHHAWYALPSRAFGPEKGLPMRSRSFVLSVFALCALLVTSTSAFAQATTTFGVQGGINIDNVSFSGGDPDEMTPDFTSKTRGVFGAFVARDFNAKAGLQIDALYSQKGTKATITDGIDTFVFEATVDYIEVPVLIRANIPGSGSVKARVFGGPSFAFKVTDSSTTTFNGVEQDEDEADAPEFKGNDFGFVIGGAVQFGQFFVDARYNWGLVNIIKDATDNEEAKTRTFGIMVGFQFK